MREQQAEGTMKAGAFTNDVAGFTDQPEGYLKEQDQPAETLARLRNVTDILRQTGVKF